MPKKAELESEVQNLQQSIERIKQEISAIRHPDEDNDFFQNTFEELKAIIQATGNAANAVIGIAENNDAKISEMRSIVSGNTDAEKILEEMTTNTQKMYEACTFQDITGQRVVNITTSLEYVEERMGSIVALLDGEIPEDTQINKPPKTEDEKLLNGPQLEGEGVSQSDIDAMFD